MATSHCGLVRHEQELPPGSCYTVTRETGCATFKEPGVSGDAAHAHLAYGDSMEAVSESGHWVKLKTASGVCWAELDAFLAG
mmetsp:Transcript_42745/g.93663  ORF Transcript_42745/g.93663 Transcript_42745/m.93663 type:complete len:82 (-) Transcript_42745:238-483(-)|eukprot:6200698-Pleurochrysis_carterae.AAC.1